MSTRKDNSVWTVLCCRVKETTHVSTRKQLVQMFWTDSESAMIMKLFRGHCLRPHRWSHLGDASHAAPERTHHPISHCSTTCPYPLWAVILCSPCLNLRASWGPLNAPDSRSQSRTQRTIQACNSNSELLERHPEDPASLSDWHVCLETLIGQWVLPLLNVNVCFSRSPEPFSAH